MHENLKSTLFIDVETVALANTYEELDAEWQKLWTKQCQTSYKDKVVDENYAQLWRDRAGIHPEFGNIACIVMGYLAEVEGKITLRLKPVYDAPEAELITQFSAIANKFDRLCAYNGKKFDFPYIARRALINSLPVPNLLNTWGKKPWEIENLDPMELWQFGGHSFPSMDLLCKNLGIPLKSIMDGSEVHDKFYGEKAYQEIARYCAQDVVSLAKLFLKLTDGSQEIAEVVRA
jgi:DNA polymerase elongation subunit (family B)